jgi:esterase/lipase superfamily enzyme
MRAIVEEYHEKPEAFMKQFGTKTDELMAKYDRLNMVLTERLENDIIKEFKQVHQLFNDFLITVRNHQHATKKNID